MPEVPHDATVALRLELGRMTDKANALEAALRKEVLAVIREEIAKAQPKKMYDTKPDGTICIVAEDEEISALKADVEHVKFWNGQLKAESDRFRAEVESLRSQFANREWQPIETAPKDGQDILAYRHPHGAFLIPRYWGNDTYQMTHWMPLPQPPDAKEGEPSV